VSVPELASGPLTAGPVAVLEALDRRAQRRSRALLAAVSDDQVREVMVDEYRDRAERTLERELRRGRPRPVQCFSCKRWKPRPSSVCGQCGDDPVGNVSGALGPTSADRLTFDESYYGERILP
jgi:hypothetical protein